MKKKMIMVAMFVGALSLGSCVDNNESASVEAVRGAKAEQLKSVATLNNATAEATLILAKAEVAIKEATAEGLKIANELQGIELEVAKAGLTARLEIAKTKAEADLLSAKATLEAAKAALIAAMDQVTTAEKQRVQDLLGKANEVLGRIDTSRKLLIDAKFAKAGLEAGLEGFKASQERTITAQKRIIATSEALIAEYGKYGQISKEEALKAANEAEAKAEGFDKVQTVATNAKTSTAAKLTVAKKLVDESVYLANATAEKAEPVLASTVEYMYSDGTHGSVVASAYSKLTADKDAMNANITGYTRDLTIAKSVLKDANKALTDKKTSESYKATEKAVVDATKVYNEAVTTSDKEQARIALNDAENALKSAAQIEENAVKAATVIVEEITIDWTTATNKLAAVNSNEAAYTALVEAWEAAMKANLDATIDADKASHDYTVQNTLATSLRGIATATSDINDLILAEKETIAEANATIAETKLVATKEEAITEKDREIAKLEQKLKIDEAAYADYMAQIKALIEAGK